MASMCKEHTTPLVRESSDKRVSSYKTCFSFRGIPSFNAAMLRGNQYYIFGLGVLLMALLSNKNYFQTVFNAFLFQHQRLFNYDEIL